MEGAAALRERLEALCAQYDRPEALALDPITLPLAFRDPMDQELAAWMAAHLAYGRVAPMLRALQHLLAPLGARPATWVRERGDAALLGDLEAALGTWKWRFHTGTDMARWILAWKRLDRETGQGLEPLLAPEAGASLDDRLSILVRRLRAELPSSAGLRFNLPDPREGAACKRWRMFLRWMIRSGWPDLGLWTRCPSADLVVPLDTHVARVSRYIGLTGRATPDGRMALEITAALREVDPLDPLRFDFALSHLGILGDCPGLRQPSCAPCPLYAICRAGSVPASGKGGEEGLARARSGRGGRGARRSGGGAGHPGPW